MGAARRLAKAAGSAYLRKGASMLGTYGAGLTYRYLTKRKGGKKGATKKPTPSNRRNATITRQHDLRTQYKKSRVSGKAKRFKRFAKKVKKANAAGSKLHLGQQASVGTLTFVTSGINNDNQQVLYPSDAAIADTDLRIMQNSGNALVGALQSAIRNVPIGTATGPLNVTTRPMFGQVLSFWAEEKMELGIKNISTEAFILDIYICKAKQDIVDTAHQTALGSWTQCAGEMQNLVGVGPFTAAVLNTFSGTVPTDANGFGAYWTVLSKQRMEMQPAEVVCTTIQPQGKWINYAQWDGKVVKKGYTVDVILVACPVWNPFGTGVAIAELQWQKICKMRMPGLFQGTQMAFSGAWAV